ncbi:hypothetical protein CJF43_21900 [Pseudomonas fragi]|uniref:Uncharacterized protein n=1 Tax=Pseudomonas fragi TaxID=296 RepID=A0A266LQZ0_PSEFR|nr:hypothetical protein [Pseudomonas fragi]OZY39715.1 hypothetical protein CJF43_21900 [Pseudomonas fragi]
MQLSDAVEIIEAFGVKRVNELLGEGWKVLAVSTSTYGDAKEGKVLPCYTLGKAAPVSGGIFPPSRML